MNPEPTSEHEREPPALTAAEVELFTLAVIIATPTGASTGICMRS